MTCGQLSKGFNFALSYSMRDGIFMIFYPSVEFFRYKEQLRVKAISGIVILTHLSSHQPCLQPSGHQSVCLQPFSFHHFGYRVYIC